MKMRELHPGESGDNEFRLILASTLAFYALLGFLFQKINIDHRLPHPVLANSQTKKIVLQINLPQEKPKPVPPPRAAEKPPVRISSKKAEIPRSAPTPPVPDPETVAVKNREIAQKKFTSLFGSGSDELVPDSGVNVLSSPKGGPAGPRKTGPQGGSAGPAGDLQINAGDIDQILKTSPGGDSAGKRKAILGEHETLTFSSAVGPGKGAGGGASSARSMEEVEKSFKAYEGRLKSYYDRTLVKKPDLKGLMVVRITLAADGHVLKCEVLKSLLNDKAFESEISRIIQEQFKFSAISGKEEYYDRALNFRPAQ